MTFYEVLEQALALLQRHKRVSYRALKLQFHLLGDASFEALRDELIYQQVARDEGGQGLVWIGETPLASAPSASLTDQRATASTAVIEPPMEHAPPSSLSPTTVPSDQLGAKPVSTRSSPEAERRQLTVMFCDLADSTKLSQQLDPEDLREVIRAYQDTAAEVIHQFEGHIAQYLGDGLLIYFGWPTAHEDEPQRALHSGLGIVKAIATTLNPRLEAAKGVQLTVRLGVHTGPVVVGEMGGGGRHEHLATGETVNIAARLEGMAAPNTVVVSQMTARLVRGTFAMENLGAHTLKGVSEPMQVYHVLRPIETDNDEDETLRDATVFLVGRDEEVGLLLRRWEQSKAGLGQVVLVLGEAGIGKSCLLATIRAHVRDEDFPCIAFRCSPYHIHSVLYPVMTQVEHLLRFDRGDLPDTKLDKIEHALRKTTLALEETVPLLATLFAIPLDGRYAPLMLSPQQQRQRTFDVLVGWLQEEAGRQPMLVMWEDLHWSDPSTLELLGIIIEQAPTVPMLHVLTFRPEFELPWPTRSHIAPLTLNRLGRPQVEALITHLTQGKALPSEVTEHIVTKTDGVPLYVEELTKTMLASDLLREEADQYMLTEPLLSVTIPDTLQDSLMARLDQLDDAKEIAQLGAVVGREFPYAILQALSTMQEPQLQAGLARLVTSELLYQRGRPPQANYIFKHALIQDAAYASLLRNTRQQVHDQIAQLLETRFPETMTTHPELVAQHYTAAGRHEIAIDYWRQAGQLASARSAHAEAIKHFAQGLDLLQSLQDTPLRMQSELQLRVGMGVSLMATRGLAAEETGHAYNRAWELCQHVGATPELFPVLWGVFMFYFVRAEYQMAHELAEQLLDLGQRQHETAPRLVAHTALGFVLFWLGELSQAREHLEQGIALYRPEQHSSLTVRYGYEFGASCFSYLASVLWLLGYPSQAQQCNDNTLRLLRDLTHPFSRARTLQGVCLFHQLHRDTCATLAQADALIALADEEGFPIWRAGGLCFRGWALAVQGQSDAGIPQIIEGLTGWQSTGAELGAAYYLGLLAEAYGLAGQADEGLRVLRQALTRVAQTGECWREAELYRLWGELLEQREEGKCEVEWTPEACFLRALELARHQEAKSLELRAAMSLSRLWYQQDKWDAAHAQLTSVYNWFSEGLDTSDLLEAKALLDARPG